MSLFDKKENEIDETLVQEQTYAEETVTEENDTAEMYEEEQDALTPEEKRELRRKRRKRNESLAVMAAVMIVLCLCAGLFFGVMGIRYLAGPSNAPTETEDEIQNLVDNMLASEETLPTEVIEVVTPEEKLDEYIDTMIAGMTLEEKIAGLIIASPEQLTGVDTATRAGDSTKAAIEAMPVAGLVYYRRNMQSNDQLIEMLNNTQSYSKHPMFLAVNEGGDSASSVQNSAVTVPSVKKPSELTEAAEAYTLGNTIGTYLKGLHFNVNFAPTADILWTNGAAVSGYCFGGDATLNASMVSEYVKGLEEAGISATLKTFPGTGHMTSSTEDGTLATEKTREEYATDFTVFKAGIDAGADFVMVSHMVARNLTESIDPCSMSSVVVTDILRDELGFEGIIITEPMNVKAITEYYDTGEAAVAALKAGCDMILLPQDLKAAHKAIVDGVNDGSVAEARINDSLKRVFRVKYASKLMEFTE